MNPIPSPSSTRSWESLAASLDSHGGQWLLVSGGEEDEGKLEFSPLPGLPLPAQPLPHPSREIKRVRLQGAPFDPQNSHVLVTGQLPTEQSWARISPFEMGTVGAHVKAVNCAAIWSQEFTCSAAETGGCMVNRRCLIRLVAMGGGAFKCGNLFSSRTRNTVSSYL